jgi:hypothetical protein
MRKLLVLLFIYCPTLVSAQRTYTTNELNRLADLGKGVGHLAQFHPSMARGIISTDSLVFDVAASLANDPSAGNFKICLDKMFEKLKDPLTHVVKDNKVRVKLLTAAIVCLPIVCLKTVFCMYHSYKLWIKRYDKNDELVTT